MKSISFSLIKWFFRFFIYYFLINIEVLAAQDYPLTSRNVDFAIIYKHEGLDHAAERNYSEAKRSLKKSLSYDPCNMEIQFYLMLADDPERYRYLSRIKEIYRLKIEAVDSLVNVLNREIDDVYIRSIFCGIIYDRYKYYAEAWELYSQGVDQDSSQAYIYYMRAGASMELSNYGDAIDNLTQALQLNSCSYRLYFRRGLANYQTKNYDLAIQDYKSAMTLAPLLRRSLHNSQLICEAYNQRGIERLRNNKYQKALADFNNAVAIHPQFSEPYLNRGVVYRNLALYDVAIEDFNLAIILNDKYVDAYFNRALTFKEMNQIERATRDLKTVIIMRPTHYKAYYELGNVLFEQEDFYGAIDMYATCLEIEPGYIWAHYKRAQCYDRLRKFPGAIQDYDYFFSLAPDSFLDQKVNAWERSKLLKEWLEQKKQKDE